MDIQFYFSLHAHNEALVIMIFQCISSLNYFAISIIMIHCVKNVRIRSYSGPHFFAFGLNTERYSASLPQGKMRTRITPNANIFYAVIISINVVHFHYY